MTNLEKILKALYVFPQRYSENWKLAGPTIHFLPRFFLNFSWFFLKEDMRGSGITLFRAP